jgi:hypothetical protein
MEQDLTKIIISALTVLALTMPASAAETPKTLMREAAEIGDIVELRKPHLTVMCPTEVSASNVWSYGAIAFTLSKQMGNDDRTMYKDMMAGIKNGMREMGCQWAPEEGRYLVTEKKIDKPNSLIKSDRVSYCLQPSDKSACRWIHDWAHLSSPLKSVNGVVTVKEEKGGGQFIGIVLMILGLAIGFLPAIVASTRKHRNRRAIIVLNCFAFFGGWIMVVVLGGLGGLILSITWVGMLVWACTSNVEPRWMNAGHRRIVETLAHARL